MDKADAARLFRNKTEQTYERGETEDLVKALDRIPLAVAQAAAYTKSFVPPCPIAGYLAKLSQTNKSDASLLKANFDELRRGLEASNSIITTWQILFEHIRSIRPSAADRLSLMSCLDHRGVPRTLLHMSAHIENVLSFGIPDFALPGQEVQDITEDTAVDNRLDGNISMLHDFHLLAVKVDTNDLGMHPLVHLSARKWLESHGKRDEYMCKSMKILDSALAINPVDGLTECLLQWKTFYPHVQLALESKPESKETWHRQMRILDGAYTFMILQRNQTEAEVLARRLWMESKHELGAEHSATLQSEKKLGGALQALGQHRDALRILEHVLSVAERQFESDRSNTKLLIECLVSIGELECGIEHFAEAEVHLRLALDHIGASHECGHNRVMCSRNLVEVLRRQEKHQEAKNVCHELLDFCAHNYEIDHRFRLTSSQLLAELLRNEGRLDEASEVLQQALEAVNHGPGHDHIYTWDATMSLVVLLSLQKKTREVVEVLRQLMEGAVKFWGEEHINALKTAYVYASVLGCTNHTWITKKCQA
jgi:tetratricopeptide (TPR) repeat protein